MVKKILMFVMALTLCVPAASFAAKDYAAELKQEQAKLIKLTKQLTVQKNKLKKLASEYEVADMAMRQRLLKDKADTDEKEYIRTSKIEQEKLRKEYYKNKKPLTVENNRIKAEYHVCKKAIKRLTKQIDRLAKDPDNEEYKAKINELKAEISVLKEKRDDAVMKIRKDADSEIAAITDMTQKSSTKNKILSKAKDKELVIRKQYTVDKDVVAAKMDVARKEYKNNLKLWRMKKAAERDEQKVKAAKEQRKKIAAQPVSADGSSEKTAVTNFCPAN
ncbi:MAG: hypothetical protein RAP41_00380 [Candidatus Orphnella occulta]|nr:hypothetical protein [Candidatus Orphnella occulta]